MKQNNKNLALQIVWLFLNAEIPIFHIEWIKKLIPGFTKNAYTYAFKQLQNMDILKKIHHNCFALFQIDRTIDVIWAANRIIKDSYITAYNVLEGSVIKQWHMIIHCWTAQRNNKKDIKLDFCKTQYKKIRYHHIPIPLTFGIDNTVKRHIIVNKERALLDMIYIHISWQEEIHSELFLHHLDKEKIEQYLQYYPKKIKDFYYNKLHEYAKSNFIWKNQ